MEPGMMGPGMEPGMMGPGMEPGMMEPGMGPGMGEGMMGQPEPPEKITKLRALLVGDEGAIDSGAIEVADYAEIVDDWVQIVLPLDRFAGPVDISEGTIKHIALFGDVEETFWVGDVTLGYEEQPLLADAGENITTKVDAETSFTAAPQPDGVNGNYIWDFDDLDGIQEEGFGRETSWTFLTPGYYVVTLTVTDPDGDQVERTDRIHVKVTE
jgi:PKD repeat protein